MKVEKILFEVEKMKARTWYKDTGQEKNTQIIEINERQKVTIDSAMFQENTINKVKIFKYTSDEDESSCIFVEAYMGNIEISTSIFKSDVVCRIETRKNTYGHEIIDRYYFGLAQRYDY